LTTNTHRWIGFFLLGLCVALTSEAQNRRWTGEVDDDWFNDLNWAGGDAPGDGSRAMFSGDETQVTRTEVALGDADFILGVESGHLGIVYRTYPHNYTVDGTGMIRLNHDGFGQSVISLEATMPGSTQIINPNLFLTSGTKTGTGYARINAEATDSQLIFNGDFTVNSNVEITSEKDNWQANNIRTFVNGNVTIDNVGDTSTTFRVNRGEVKLTGTVSAAPGTTNGRFATIAQSNYSLVILANPDGPVADSSLRMMSMSANTTIRSFAMPPPDAGAV
jgi:hypothetical protein